VHLLEEGFGSEFQGWDDDSMRDEAWDDRGMAHEMDVEMKWF
jgi:hypothetical protein